MFEMEMKEDDLASIRTRCQAASLGPWKSFIEGRDHTSGSNFIMVGDGASRGTDIELTGATRADQDFIAQARQDVPRLLDEVERLRNLLSSARR